MRRCIVQIIDGLIERVAFTDGEPIDVVVRENDDNMDADINNDLLWHMPQDNVDYDHASVNAEFDQALALIAKREKEEEDAEKPRTLYAATIILVDPLDARAIGRILDFPATQATGFEDGKHFISCEFTDKAEAEEFARKAKTELPKAMHQGISLDRIDYPKRHAPGERTDRLWIA